VGRHFPVASKSTEQRQLGFFGDAAGGDPGIDMRFGLIVGGHFV